MQRLCGSASGTTFAEGCNIGIRYALAHMEPEYVLLLNNDTVVAPDFLDELVSVAEADPRIGILGPKIYYYDFHGRKDVIWAAGGKVRWWHPWVYDGIGTNERDAPRYNRLGSVDWVSGSAMMIKRGTVETLSYLDPRYFFGNEDVEYCIRARKRGLKVVYVPTARVWHKVGKSRKKRGPRFSDLPPYYRLLRRNWLQQDWLPSAVAERCMHCASNRRCHLVEQVEVSLSANGRRHLSLDICTYSRAILLGLVAQNIVTDLGRSLNRIIEVDHYPCS